VIDLKTGCQRSHRPEDYMTKMTGAAADSSCPTPLFDAFLDTVTLRDKAYQAFLARVCGYSLTGITREHAMFFLHGDGGNGKTVFINTVSGIMGDYHRTAPIETLTATQNEQHPTDLATLRGARMVSATETEEGRRWNESKIKTLTGGNRISARFMRQDFFEYDPQFKLMVSGNHKPGLRSVDEAIRRFNLLPFVAKISETEKDKELGNKLMVEWPGILHWMIAGCLDWQQQGLAPPKAVNEATDNYLAAEDTVTRWLDDCCEKDPNGWTLTNTLRRRCCKRAAKRHLIR
jgi:putative DNA primase/helicase